MKSKYLFIAVMMILLVGVVGNRAIGQTPGLLSTDTLYQQIAQMDSVLFGAFNKRDVEKFKTLFTKDLEFYHDKGGLTGYDHTIEFMISTAKSDNGLRRELVKGSLEVYPIPGYGAMEIGEHRFCHVENGKNDCGTFKFVHVWQKKDGKWKISRVISYGH